ncbi:aminotransferase class I/II-fold pyridoxal phosphate-dependent enzyme [Fusibacter ferrireducens]|uniref:Aminotransferase class V-fold PLP-dependent enzyme n=1 Tax=Fusibacter ferrireducens TaxID=2785058 RepID=A0ABR9ZS13_9FIRM|nr:aminotransferase class I/II-fold pyridoxal phosphate-dependent enzyme [Fusibacter ferrireducens]MBF4693230.1 aminotransferase class V-fold PLP-dependent enzyme [Fusibacter ferrireducens]
MRLLEALRAIESEQLHSFYMPGHKKHPQFIKKLENLIHLDITEIPKADHLHEPKGCILETQNLIASTYESGASRLLVNGSTVGLLSMIIGSLDEGDAVLINRNAHKSVYNAITFAKLKPYYYLPEYDDYMGIVVDYDVERICSILKENTHIKAVILTYPTYEGVCMALKRVIDFSHERNILVLVDEAHGAHLKFNSEWPISALDLGADIVVQSFHKTLPALTQTACLHYGKHLTESMRGKQIIQQVDDCLKTFQTSSPSYVLMASVDAMLDLMLEEGKLWSEELTSQIEWLYKETQDLKTIAFYHTKVKKDPSKLLLQIHPDFYEEGVWDGEVLSKCLREMAHIQVEYETQTILLFMTSICNDHSDFEALANALKTLDKLRIFELSSESIKSEARLKQSSKFNFVKLYEGLIKSEIQIYLPHEVKRKTYTEVMAEAAIGEISADFITPYPPGIPILVPGERITQGAVDLLKILLGAELKKIKILERSLEESSR